MTPPDDEATESDRRAHDREVVCIPAYAHTIDSPERVALIRDISLSGALFLSPTSYDEGSRIELVLHLTGDPEGPAHEVTCDVVRVEERDPEQAGLWPFAVAVHFDVELDELAEDIERLSALLAERCPD